MKILQIGPENWANELELPEKLDWFYSSAQDIEKFITDLEETELQKLLEAYDEELSEKPKVQLKFNAVLLTGPVSERSLEKLIPTIEAHSLFQDVGVENQSEYPDGIFRRKMLRTLPKDGSRQEKIDYLNLNLFGGQYGAKLKVPEIDVHPHFQGQVFYDGHVGVEFSGDFGQDFQPLMTFRYNLSSFDINIEIWQEYIKSSGVELQMELVGYQRGSLADIVKTIVIDQETLETPYVIAPDGAIGSYTVSIWAKGQGELKVGACHWRYSRDGLGQFVLGGKRYSDSKRQEIISYFNPGDLKPPLTVYFSGFRGAEGFEGFYMMKSMKTPFMLIGDPRLEGGCFYAGTEELESSVQTTIQEALDYLGFDGSQLILSGLSMGTFGAAYFASHFNPHAIVVGKPFTNIGDTVAALALKRPDEFETSGDMIRNIIGGADAEAIDQLNDKFWKKFNQSRFSNTTFALAFMEHDDYDGMATQRLIENLVDEEAHVISKGYEGRHNDNSRAINRWFITQYHKILMEDFGRTF